jgi:hypothetical protein
MSGGVKLVLWAQTTEKIPYYGMNLKVLKI